MTVTPSHLALIVDPDTESRDLYDGILTLVVSEIEYADDGRDALAKAIGHLPGLIIMETRLAFISGYTLCSLLRSDPITSDVPIVVVTVDANPPDIERARTSGADSVLAKPFLPEALLQSIVRGRDRSARSDRRSEGMSDRSAGQSAICSSSIEPSAERTHRVLSRAHRRFETCTPPVTPPELRCPSCDQSLQYVTSHIGGVSARLSEQWDYYTCRSVCGTFQYRQRTRRLRRVQ
jgi:CheY-like chemotaxis protein